MARKKRKSFKTRTRTIYKKAKRKVRRASSGKNEFVNYALAFGYGGASGLLSNWLDPIAQRVSPTLGQNTDEIVRFGACYLIHKGKIPIISKVKQLKQMAKIGCYCEAYELGRNNLSGVIGGMGQKAVTQVKSIFG